VCTFVNGWSPQYGLSLPLLFSAIVFFECDWDGGSKCIGVNSTSGLGSNHGCEFDKWSRCGFISVFKSSPGIAFTLFTIRSYCARVSLYSLPVWTCVFRLSDLFYDPYMIFGTRYGKVIITHDGALSPSQNGRECTAQDSQIPTIYLARSFEITARHFRTCE